MESWRNDDFGSASSDEFKTIKKLKIDRSTHPQKECAGSFPIKLLLSIFLLDAKLNALEGAKLWKMSENWHF